MNLRRQERVAESVEKIIKIYDQIRDQFESGKLAFIVFKAIREQFQKQPERPDDIFITTLVLSTYNTIILSLANTVKPQKDSVHIQYLINCINNSKEIFDSETRKHFNSFIGEFEAALKTIDAIIERIIEFRDTSVAHIDKEHINNPGFLLQKQPISCEDIELAYNVVNRAISEIGKYLNADRPGQEFIGLAYLDLMKKTWVIFRLFYGDQWNSENHQDIL